MRTMTLEEFKDTLRAQKVSTVNMTFICPRCGMVQSAQDLIDAGAGKTLDDVEKYLAFSCVGRWTNAGPPRKEKDGKGCNWTLGGLFQLHELEVVTPDGEHHPRFLPSNA